MGLWRRADACLWLWAAVLGFAVLIALCAVPQIDVALSAGFYYPRLTPAWYFAASALWRGLYRYGEYPALCMAGGAVVGLLGGHIWRSWRGYRRRCLFLILAVALGPGLLVNGLLKPGWGRPRPRQVEQFGGPRAFQPWWQPGGPGAGESFLRPRGRPAATRAGRRGGHRTARPGVGVDAPRQASAGH
jgi:membrane-associated PAP2 superfamily phosphatase